MNNRFCYQTLLPKIQTEIWIMCQKEKQNHKILTMQKLEISSTCVEPFLQCASSSFAHLHLSSGGSYSNSRYKISIFPLFSLPISLHPSFSLCHV